MRAQEPAAVKLPTPAEGNVEGRQGISFWPSIEVDGEARVVDPTGCVVYLVASNVNERLTNACGKWFAPPADRYSVWLEQGNHISAQTVINSAGSKFSDNGVIVVMPLNDAGSAAIAPDVPVEAPQTVRFLSIEPSSVGFEKRLQSPDAHSAHRLPAGKAIAGVFDGEGEALALSRPFSTTPGTTTLVRPDAPANAADLMLVFGKRQASLREREKRNTKISAVVGGTVKEPDVLYETSGRMIAIWYAVTARTATIKVASDTFRLEDREVRLTPGTVTTLREDLDLNTKGVIR
jgi:hypothetical protein